MRPGSPAQRVIRCPACGGPSVYAPRNALRPFCSERCRHLDLGAWASGRYAVPVEPAEPLQPAEAPASGADAGDAPRH